MSQIGNIEPYVMGESFKEYIHRLEMYFTVNDIAVEKKVPVLITMAGASLYSVAIKLCAPDDPRDKTYADLVKVLEKHFKPNVNVVSERYLLRKCKQTAEQSIADYIIELKAAAQTCDFGSFLSDALRDQFVAGVYDLELRKRLLKKEDLKFVRACEIARSWEAAQEQNEVMTDRERNVLAAMQKAAKQQPVNQQRGQQVMCRRCGKGHDPLNCPARTWKCYVCGKQGHVAKVCRGRSYQRGVRKVEGTNTSVPQMITLVCDGKKLVFEIDCGACASVISQKTYTDVFSEVEVKPTTMSFISASGQSLKPIGKIEVKIRMPKAEKEEKLELVIIPTEREVSPLLGRDGLDLLFPNWRKVFEIKVIETDLVMEIAKKFPKVIKSGENETIEGFKADLVLKAGCGPVFHKAYPVPYSMQTKVEEALDKLVAEGVLRPTRFSKWASPIVIVKKQDGR
ncbi:uncharacterized protein LOC133393118 [Anopheles gambiae]|uniref:uncharacterized protein LOC133393118 n=1 Tax=Anopheles gambiae TaxID=7165 RepID=UPI002AC92907|nr:uncharacterized protein LOC133393118 [Anopheles gambiae]